MKFNIAFEKTYPHPIETVWRAVTDRQALGAWLMETDFAAEVGREFSMWCDDGEGGTDRYRCKVLEIEPPHRMLWSWVLDGRQGDGATTVEFVLRAVEGATSLSIRHSGDRDRDTVEKFKSGWPYKMDQLEVAVENLS